MSKIRQQYHLEPEKGLLNDPNGLSWFRGKYYVFFQWNRFEKNHSYKEWGQFSSKNLLDWEFDGSAILPDQEYDRDGVYSGSGYVIGDQLYLFYTGNNKKDGKRKSSQCLAVTGDGRRFQKKGIILKTPEEYTEHFRDPKVFAGKHSGYYMVVGGQQKNGKGGLALCYSEDGETWNYKKMLAASKKYEMIECPDLFELDGKYVLLFNPQKRDNAADETISSFSAYKLGEFDEDNGIFQDANLDEGFEVMDAGFDFYAPQTFLSPDGRRILFAWMSRMEEEQEKVFSRTEPNIHCMTLPRELSLREEKLCQNPMKELYDLLGQEIAAVCEKQEWRAYPDERTFFLHLKRTGEEQKLSILFHQGEAELEYSSEEQKLIFSRRNWVNDTMETKSAVIDEWNELEIWSDHSSIEIFVNGGEVVFSARIFPKSKKPEVVLKGSVNDMEIEMREIMKKDKKEEPKA